MVGKKQAKSRIQTMVRKLLLIGAGVLFVFCCLVFIRLLPHPPLKEIAPYSRLVLSENGTLLRFTLAQDDHYRLWRPLDDISPSLIDAVLLKEDRYFYYHFGVNPLALFRATVATYLGGNRQGASTISMQLARRSNAIQSRNIFGKLQQIMAALWLEMRYSKRELLEAYLNLAPMGGNIDGVEAASRIYFHKTAQNLSLNEAITLAVMPQNPTIRAKFGSNLQEARRRLIREWHDTFPDDRRNKSLFDTDVDAYHRKDLPFLAPHYADYLLKNYPDPIVQGTLDERLQSGLERIVAQYITKWRRTGLKNASVLLIDTRDMSVKAMIGSADFFDKTIHGQVNGTIASRSPGSTVKPFLYALAIDQGLIHPMTMLKDAPSIFGAFQPENFDGRFVGPLSAQDALIRSRNVPAVYLANQTRNPTLYQFFHQAGISGLRPEESYGLSIALGGGEMKMTELATLYALLARDGRLRPLRYLAHEKESVGAALLSSAAAFITRDMLYQHVRVDGLPPDSRGQEWRVAWKTGTSWSYHDGWTAGIVGPYVLIVWTGNFDNSGSTAFIGVKTAAPLFFHISDALPLLKPDIRQVVDAPPMTVRRIDVCAASGDLPNKWCPQIKKTWFIPGVSPIKVSTLHQAVMVDIRTGKAACPPYDKDKTKLEVFEFWPSDLRRLFASAGLPRRMPPIMADCAPLTIASGIAPQIKFPALSVTYVIKAGKAEDSIPLKAEAGADVKMLYWFNGQSLIGQVNPGETLDWRPLKAGPQHLRVTDDQGRSTKRTITVEFTP